MPRELGYPPLDTPKLVGDGVYTVDSRLDGPLGAVLPARMTVLELPGGELLLHSPTRFSPRLASELEALGRIAHLVTPNIGHWMFLQAWQQAFPGATVWAAPGLRGRRAVRRSGVRLDRDLPEGAAAAWGGAVELVVVPGGLGFHEVALFHRRSATLVLTDLVLNLDPAKLPPWFRPVARAFGIVAPDGMPPPYVRAIIRLRQQEAAQAAAALVALDPHLVLFAHGHPFVDDATGALRRSLRWLLPAG